MIVTLVLTAGHSALHMPVNSFDRIEWQKSAAKAEMRCVFPTVMRFSATGLVHRQAITVQLAGGLDVDKISLQTEEVAMFLGEQFENVASIVLLKGGAWSTAFRFDADGRPLVVKFGRHRDDYERDALAGSWNLPDAPTPEVFALGEAFDGWYLISEFAAGEGFDELPAERFAQAQTSVVKAYDALSKIDLPGAGFGIWVGPSGDAPHETWSEYLTSVPLLDDDRLRGWQERLAAMPTAHSTFYQAQRFVELLAPNCPNERAVNHGDPLWGNILIADDNSVTALLDWGVSIVGDPLFDLAMLMFCQPWHAGINVDQLLTEASRRAGTADIDERLRASMLNIGLGTLRYQAFAGGIDDLAKTSAWMTRLMGAGRISAIIR